MKILASSRLATLLAVCGALSGVCPPPLAFAQGPLTPPGAPGPTMKTLDQVEARTPIPGGTTPYTISASGSYYLTGNLAVSGQNVILINASRVTLDLNGFTVSSAANPAAATAIVIVSGMADVTVRNGQVFGPGTVNAAGTFSGGGFIHGVLYDNPSGTDVGKGLRVHDLTVSGCAGDGFNLYAPASSSVGSSVAERCVARHIGGYGFIANVIRGCSATDCGAAAFFGHTLSDCTGSARGNGGTDAVNARQAANCSGQTGGSGAGLSTLRADNCTGVSNAGTGLRAEQASNCRGVTTTGPAGLEATNASNCSGELTSGNGTGLSANTAVGCLGIKFGNGGMGLSALNATNCNGINNNGSGVGLSTRTADGCNGFSTFGTGLDAETAQNSKGASTQGTGLRASRTATNCIGESANGTYALFTNVAQNCQGQSTGAATGLHADYLATNCVGISVSGRGLVTSVATGSYGQTDTGDVALFVVGGGTATHCRGWKTMNGGIAISAGIAIGCTTAGGTIVATSKFLGTP